MTVMERKAQLILSPVKQVICIPIQGSDLPSDRPGIKD